MKMQTALTLQEVTPVHVLLDMRVMASTAQVCKFCTVQLMHIVINNDGCCKPLSLDINECSGNLHNCHDNATCSDTDGSFECFCNPGFDGDGVNCSSMYI